MGREGGGVRGVRDVATFGLLLLLALLLAVWEAFLVPLRVGGVPVPLSVVAAVVGNVTLARAAARLFGRVAAIAPGLVWLTVALVLGSRRAEGDLVVPGTLSGMAFLVVGSLAAVVGYALARDPHPVALHPEA